MVDLVNAFSFLTDHGQAHHLRLGEYAVGSVTSADVIQAMLPFQHESGGWMALEPETPVDSPGIRSCYRALQWLRWISADNHEAVDKTATFLARHQHMDGSWHEVQSEPTPPGEIVLLTAAICRALMETGHETEVYFGRALNYLSDAWNDGTVHDPDTPIAAFTMMLPLFKIGGQSSDQHIVDGCTDKLSTAIEANTLDPADTVSIAHAALLTRYAGRRLYVRSRNRALELQESDGGWATRRGEAHRPNVTVDALLLLLWSGML